MSLLQNSNAISEAGGYNIANSLRFQSASSQYLSRTPASAGNRQKITLSAWVKIGTISTDKTIISSGASTYIDGFTINAGNNLYCSFSNAAGTGEAFNFTSNMVFRDPSSWYHIVITIDTTQATSTDRLKAYVNGTQITFGTVTYPTLNYSFKYMNTNLAQFIGKIYSTGQWYFDGHMTEVNFIDGQALTPSSFGETNTLTGQWVAKKYTGTYGTNGFYLPFSNGTSTTTLGYDSSGNSNNWTLNNFTRSAGVSDCWMIDVPSGNSGASAVQPSSNYCTWNNLVYNAGGISFSNANLRLNYSSNIDRINIGNIATNTGKFYWEVTIAGLSASSDFGIGICKQTLTNNTWVSFGGPNVIYYSTSSGWSVYGSNIGGATGSFSNGDIVGVSVDFDANVISIYQNNTLLTSRSGSIDTTVGHTVFGNSYRSGSTLNLNCGQRSFAYTPPSGFRALCTANLPAATIKKGNTVFDATLYTGTGANQTIINAAGFSPDIVWGKSRSTADFHVIANTVVGANKYLFTNSTSAEGTLTDVITSFNSNGFTLGANQTINVNGAASVAWQWDAGSSTVTNTNGTISSSVRANASAGVSVVTYTGNGTAGATIGHGLGVTPAMVIIKERSTTSAWSVWHKAFTFNEYIQLNTTGAKGTASGWFSANSNTFGFPTFYAGDLNDNGTTCVAYCFAEIAGFSKFGSYTGNGSADGPFVYTGFRPKFVMVKPTSYADDWLILDSSRDTYNVTSNYLRPNLSNAEGSAGVFDFTANGFKVRFAGGAVNTNAATMIFMAFAESPFANSNSR